MDGDAISHHHLFAAAFLKICLTLYYKGLILKVILTKYLFPIDLKPEDLFSNLNYFSVL